jgi:hypothetical protein
VKRQMPREKRKKPKIRVYTTYTLFEAFEKIWDGKIKVEGARIIIDVMTNDVRGTRGQPRVTPEEVAIRVGRVVTTVKEKGARGVAVCEVKPMSLLDVIPFSDLLRRRCVANKIGWCQTQLGIVNLKDDGYHILPSFLQVLDATYAYAVMELPVPHPTPNYKKWRHKNPERDWPQLQENQRMNFWRRREQERRTRTGIH